LQRSSWPWVTVANKPPVRPAQAVGKAGLARLERQTPPVEAAGDGVGIHPDGWYVCVVRAKAVSWRTVLPTVVTRVPVNVPMMPVLTVVYDVLDGRAVWARTVLVDPTPERGRAKLRQRRP